MDALYDDIFDIDLGGRPATYTVDASDADSDEYEIVVSFSRDNAPALGVQNANPVAYMKTSAVPGISVASQIVIHYGYLTDENDENIRDESGELLIAENEYTYNVVSVHDDAFGLTMVELSLISPR